MDADNDYSYMLSACLTSHILFKHNIAVDDDPIEYIQYTRDATGRVVAVETHDKVPRQNIKIIETRPKTSGHITDVKLQSKQDVDLRVTTSVKTDSTMPTAFDAGDGDGDSDHDANQPAAHGTKN